MLHNMAFFNEVLIFINFAKNFSHKKSHQETLLGRFILHGSSNYEVADVEEILMRVLTGSLIKTSKY
jgi:hypothetical protein